MAVLTPELGLCVASVVPFCFYCLFNQFLVLDCVEIPNIVSVFLWKCFLFRLSQSGDLLHFPSFLRFLTLTQILCNKRGQEKAKRAKKIL